MILDALYLLSLLFLPLISASQPPIAESTFLDPFASKELFRLHRKLVKIESITGNEKQVGQWLTAYLRNRDWTVERQQVAKNRYNIFAYGSKRDTSILLTSHIDTVPPYWPYYYNKTTGMIGGRGSVDAKASVAAQIIAAEGLRENLQDDLSLLFVVGEEVDGQGMSAFSSWKNRPQAHETVIFGEPTEQKLVCGHKGKTHVTLRATGKAAHSGYPWLGVSANDVLVEALAELLKLRKHLPWSEKYGNTTMNFGRIQGGVASNVIAETARADVMTRIAAGTPDTIRSLVIKALEDVTSAAQKEGGNLEFEWDTAPYAPVDMKCDIEGFDKLTVNYGTDVPHLTGNHDKYLYGPGSIFVAHSDHEALKKTELEQAVLDYQRIIISVSKSNQQEKRRGQRQQRLHSQERIDL